MIIIINKIFKHLYLNISNFSNIMINSTNNQVQLADFGIFELIKEKLLNRNEVNDIKFNENNFLYMSPELLNLDESSISQSTDIWSIGAVLNEMITNKRPYKSIESIQNREQVDFQISPKFTTIHHE